MTIVGTRVNLRQIVPGDGRWLAQAMGRGAWWRWDAPWEGKPRRAELRRAARYFDLLVRARTQPPARMIIETRAGAPIGTVSRYWVDERTLWMEVGVGIFAARHWGRGYGTEALALWVDHLFATLPLRRIGLRTWSGNRRMIRLARRLGFRPEATYRDAYVAAGRAYDRLAFGLLRREWLRVRRSWPAGA